MGMPFLRCGPDNPVSKPGDFISTCHDKAQHCGILEIVRAESLQDNEGKRKYASF